MGDAPQSSSMTTASIDSVKVGPAIISLVASAIAHFCPPPHSSGQSIRGGQYVPNAAELLYSNVYPVDSPPSNQRMVHDTLP